MVMSVEVVSGVFLTMLTAENISFLYSPRRGVEHASFQLDTGEVMGVMGPNGAGKSTLLGMLAGAMHPQRGKLSLRVTHGNKPGRIYSATEHFAYRRHLGYLTEQCPVYPEMTVRRYLSYRATLKGERYLRIRRRVNEAIERCRLEDVAHERLSGLSAGYHKRVCFAEAILLKPRLLVLDDPFAGLDVEMRTDCSDLIRSLAGNSAIIVSGHDPEMLKTCCTRFAVMRKSRLVGSDYSCADALARIAMPETEEEPPCE